MLWHSDGLEVQEKLCERMAALVGKFKIAKNRWTYVQSAIEILNREWLGIDRLRMSKFMLVCRLLLRSSFEVIGKEGWNVADINWFVGVMSVGPLQYHQPAGKSSAPLGIRYVSIYIPPAGKDPKNLSNSSCTLFVNSTGFLDQFLNGDISY